MEAKQISLFCLLLAALAGKIETKPSGSLNSVGLTAGEAQLSSIRAASVGQSNVAQDHFSSSLGSAGSFGTGTGGVGTLHRGYPNGVTALDGLNNGFTGFGLNSIHGQSGFFGQGLESYGNFGQDIIDCQGLGGSGGNCQQRTGRIGIPVDCGCGSYQQFTPGCNIYGGGFDQQLSNPGFSSLDIGQQLSNPGFSSLDIGQQLNSGLGNLGTSQGSNLDISALTGRFNDAGLDYLYSPCTSCNQDLGFNNILGNSRGCQSGSQGIPFGTGCGTYQQSLSPFAAGCNDLSLSCQQGITASASCGVCQGITGTTGRGACQRGSPCMVDSNNVDYLQLQGITGTTGSGYCQSCQSTPICDNTCDSTCTDAVVVVAVPVVEDDCVCGDGTVVTDPCLTC